MTLPTRRRVCTSVIKMQRLSKATYAHMTVNQDLGHRVSGRQIGYRVDSNIRSSAEWAGKPFRFFL